MVNKPESGGGITTIGTGGGGAGRGTMDGPKVVELDPPNEIAAAGELLRRNEALVAENVKIVARMRRAAYVAYIEAGFSKEEALTLCVK